MTGPADTSPPARWTILTTAAYLACSWTWCIGMFLPVILMRDYGPWSFAAFAVPNVIGAALMGVVLMQPGASASVVARHRSAVKLFSWITVVFQYFFTVWLLLGIGFSLEALGLLLLFVLAGKVPRHQGHAALLVFVASIAMFVWLLKTNTAPMPWAATFPGARPGALLYLSPICLFGFALCPYLDGTFHHALQRLPGWRGSIAFLLGFGVLFLAMIAFTFFYATSILAESTRTGFPPAPQLATWPVIIHMALQLGITTHFHGWLPDVSNEKPARPENLSVPALMLIGCFLPVLGWRLKGYHDLSFNECVYRLFMSFYALIFPAYVWLCMIPTWRSGEPTRRHLTIWLVACALAAPAFWMGFFEHQEIWLLPGLGVVLLARLLIPRSIAVEPSGASPMQEGSP